MSKTISVCFAALLFLFAGLQGVLASQKNILILGDSLTAGYGLPPGQAFPDRLGEALRQSGIQVNIINAGVSGDTTAGGLARLDWSVPSDVDGVIIELGANDGLRGIDPRVTKANLDAIITRLKDRNIPVLLTGMLAPPNMGSKYGNAFKAVFTDLARKHDVPLYPFFLKDVATVKQLNQPDGIHPNEAGVAVVVRNITPTVKQFIASIPD
ncbi:MAG: arylesterase [Pseudomonadota bacterium]